MRLTAKRLSELTAVPAANIRKWRERYGILSPERGENGYLYYTSDDYRVVLSIKRKLDDGNKLSAIMQSGRPALLASAPKAEYTKEEMHFLERVIESNFTDLSRDFDAILKLNNAEFLVKKKIWPMTILIGKAWESGFITVATEHAYTRWVMGYLSQLALSLRRSQKSPERIFVAFPGDEHELGAMMHYVLMSATGQGGKFCGALPMEKLIEELSHGDYDEVHVSATIPRGRDEIDRFVHAIHTKFAHVKIKIGGSGLKAGEGVPA